MPKLYISKCNECDFETDRSSGAYMYVVDENGNKIICPHPRESSTLSKVLGISTDDALAWLLQQYEKISPDTKKKIDDSTGMRYQYVCLSCFEENHLDKKSEEMKCAKCASSELKHVSDLVNNICPKCHKGTIEMVDGGIS